jgi:hypothetical protein
VLNCVHNLQVKVQEIAHKYLKIIYVNEMVKMAYFDISKTSNVKMGCFWYNGDMIDIFFITAAAVVIYGIAYLLETETFKK